MHCDKIMLNNTKGFCQAFVLKEFANFNVTCVVSSEVSIQPILAHFIVDNNTV